MRERTLPFPCPDCGGVVCSNGQVVCQKCKKVWQDTDTTPAMLLFLGEVIYSEQIALKELQPKMQENLERLECENPEAVIDKEDLDEYLKFATSIIHILSKTRMAISAMDKYLAERPL